MELDLNSRIDRYINRQLHPAAARALAHEALDDSNLFDELTAVAMARAALDSPATTDKALAQAALDDDDLFDILVARGAVESSLQDPAFQATLVAQHRDKHLTLAIVGMAAAAAAAGLMVFLLRPSSHPVQQEPAPQAQAIVSKPAVTPAILLASDLQPTRQADAPVFRGDGSASRAPKTDGVIVTLEDGVATINLGSIDGLAKGVVLPVSRGRQIGRIAITTVFRDRARGDILDGETIQANDQVSVPNRVHVQALLQVVNALATGGDLAAARELARKSVTAGSPGEVRQLLERLAALDYQAGAADAARERYEVAVNNFDQPPAADSAERAATLASLGALSLQNGDQQRADDLLQKALVKAADPVLRSQILNNLGVVAELHSDAAKASGYYQQALTLQSSKTERDLVQSNLARIENAKRP